MIEKRYIDDIMERIDLAEVVSGYGISLKARLLPSESILHYLQATPEYYGQATTAERFRKFTPSGTPVQEQVVDGGNMTYKTLWQKDRPLCFDYEMICEKYDINLDSVTEEETDDKAPPKEPEVLPF